MNEGINRTILEFIEFIRRAPLDESRFPVFEAYTINIINSLKESIGFKNDILEVHFDHQESFFYEAMYCAESILSNEPGKSKHQFMFNKNSDFFQKFYSEEVNVREKTMARFLFNLFHEFRHYMQNKAVNTVVASKYNMDIFKARIVEYDEYLQNHDLFFSELDANKFAIRRLKGIVDMKRREQLNIIESANFIEPFYVEDGFKKYRIFDRADYINRECDKKLSSFDPDTIESTLLKYEYNKNHTPKSISQLYNDMNEQISKVALMSIDDESKNSSINSIKEMYYDIFLYRLSNMKDGKFFNQIFELSYKDVKSLFEQLLEYSKKVWGVNKRILLERKKVRELHNARVMHNFRQMIKIDDDYAMKVDDYFEKYHLENLAFLKPYVPECGYYYLCDGEKIFVIDFINEYVIPEGISNKLEYNRLLIELGVEPLSEVEYSMGQTTINDKYYAIRDRLIRFERIYSDNLYSCFTSRYSRRTLKNMALIRDICDCVAFVEDYDIKFLKTLIEPAKTLTDDLVLNPERKNYYAIFMFKLTRYNDERIQL